MSAVQSYDMTRCGENRLPEALVNDGWAFKLDAVSVTMQLFQLLKSFSIEFMLPLLHHLQLISLHPVIDVSSYDRGGEVQRRNQGDFIVVSRAI